MRRRCEFGLFLASCHPARFPPPWVIDEHPESFIVRDATGQALAYVYFEDEPSRRSAANLLTRDEAGRIAAYRWSKEFLEAGKKRLAGDTARAATSDEVKDLRREAGALKEVVAELTLENRLLKKA